MKQIKTTIYYQTKTLFTNTGDVLINKSLLGALRRYGTIRANRSSEIPASFIDALGIREEEKVKSETELSFILNILRNALKGRVFIVSGLGHICGGGNQRIVRNLIASSIFAFYRLLNVRIIRIGFSIGPVSRGLALSESLRGYFVSKYYVRDTKSLALCHAIGIKKAELCPDMSWLYEFGEKRQIQVGGGKTTILLSFRRRGFAKSVSGHAEDPIAEQVLNALSFLKSRLDLKIIVAYQVAEDALFCGYLAGLLRNNYEVEFIDKQMTLDDAREVYRKAVFTISNRLHSLLLSYKYGCVPVALVDKEENLKIVSTFEDCGLGELLINIGDDSSVLETSLEHIIDNKEELYHKVVAVEAQKQKEIIACLDSIFSV